MKIFTNCESFCAELIDVAKLFFTEDEFTFTNTIADADIKHICTETKNLFINQSSVFEVANADENSFTASTELEYKKMKKRFAKINLYRTLLKLFKKSPPWGGLTGIRPTKLAYEMIEENEDYKQAFITLFDVSKSKIALVDTIIHNQTGLREINESNVDLYIGIPFCVSRCSYCSFSGGLIDKMSKYISPYIDSLVTEIKASNAIIENNHLKLNNIYIGGGTPTSLDTASLAKILAVLKKPLKEFTIEAGRPDTITLEKLQLFKEFNVNRLSINPQTFNQNTLNSIGRTHTVQQIYDAFKLARQFDFKINMDLIAGLIDETFEIFCDSLAQTIAMQPDNITVHSLALKNGSKLKGLAIKSNNEAEVSNMIDFSRKTLMENSYEPYYMYRQKYVSGNLENVGYAKDNTQCRYNIDIMEETTSILACGSGAISKRVFPAENRLERQPNIKDVILYIEKIENEIEKKKRLFSINV